MTVSPESIGVVIPTYGGLDAVATMLHGLVGEHVDAADRPGAVVVVDDAYPHAQDPSVLPHDVTFVRRSRNGGFGAAVNTGIEALGSMDYALVLNSDLHLPSGFLREFAHAASAHQPAVIGCRTHSLDGVSGYSARVFPTVSQQVIEWLTPLASQRHRDILHRAVGHDMRAERADHAVHVDWVSGAVMLLPVAAVREVGGFDESFFMYTEEVDLQRRLRDKGVAAVFLPQISVGHEGGGSAESEARRRVWLTNARDLYARKHLNPYVLRGGLAAATAINLAWNTMRRLAGRDVQPLKVARLEAGLIIGAMRFAPAHTRRAHADTAHTGGIRR